MTDGHGFLAADLLDQEEIAVERSLRPRSLDEYLGQREVKAGLSVLLQAARQRGEAADHVLLHGPPGLGKTTLATIIARELGVNIRYTSGPAIERAGDLAAVLTALDERDVLFIDEIHRLNRAVEEILYPAMEDCALDVMIGKGPSARSLRLTLRPFTIVGATTRAGRISGPLRDRFGAVYRLDFYAEEDLRAIVRRSAAILGLEVTDDAAAAIAARGRATPRIVNRLLKRVRDHAEVHGDGRVTLAAVDEAMRVLEIDAEGLDATDRRLLAAIIVKFGGGPVGVAALAAVLAEEVETVEDVYEPYLLRIGFLDRTPQGRVATDRARAHLAALGLRRAAAPGRPRAQPSGRPPRRPTPSRVPPSPPTRRERRVTGAARFEILVAPPADGSTRARLGRLHLPHGVVETPTFMPVGTNATIKALHPDEIEETGARIILANTYHLYLRPGHERIERLGGLHEFMSWPHPILTDSGGFQVVSLGDLNAIDDDGVTFQSHHDGSRHRFTAERSMEIQAALGADVAVAFDQPVPPASTDARRRGDRDGAHPPLGRPIARGAPAARPGALRCDPGRPGPRPSAALDRVHRGAAVRRPQHRRPRRRRDAEPARGRPRPGGHRRSTAIRASAT